MHNRSRTHHNQHQLVERALGAGAGDAAAVMTAAASRGLSSSSSRRSSGLGGVRIRSTGGRVGWWVLQRPRRLGAAAMHCGCWGALLLAAATGRLGATASATAAAATVAATTGGRSSRSVLGGWTGAWHGSRASPAFVPPASTVPALDGVRRGRGAPGHLPQQQQQQQQRRRGYAATGPLRLNRLLFEPGEVEREGRGGRGGRCRVRLPGGDPRAVHVREVGRDSGIGRVMILGW